MGLGLPCFSSGSIHRFSLSGASFQLRKPTGHQSDVALPQPAETEPLGLVPLPEPELVVGALASLPKAQPAELRACHRCYRGKRSGVPAQEDRCWCALASVPAFVLIPADLHPGM